MNELDSVNYENTEKEYESRLFPIGKRKVWLVKAVQSVALMACLWQGVRLF